MSPPTTGPTGPRGLLLVAVVLGVAVLGAGVVVWFLAIRHDQPDTSDSGQIRQAVLNFAAATDHQDLTGILGVLCNQEASQITDEDDDGQSNGPPLPYTTPLTGVQISSVRIVGNAASAVVTRPPRQPFTLYFRKEGGAWKVCAPAAAQLKSSASSSSTPTR